LGLYHSKSINHLILTALPMAAAAKEAATSNFTGIDQLFQDVDAEPGIQV
jgi:hypothetical protein